tara:strand:- start:83 stop:262 length:180 start_codon:yes stop_codon:yes gene_type:complete
MSDNWDNESTHQSFRNKDEIKKSRRGVLMNIAQKLMSMAGKKQEPKTEFGSYENVKVED